jgi:hypothetical protein
MLLIFGYHPIHKKVGPTEEKDCARCGNRRHWLLQKTTYWISLFFIPLIPTKILRYEACPVCQNSTDLAQSEYEEKAPLARLNQEAIDKDMTAQEYSRRLSQL